jgi:hypothetical protein
MKLNKINGFGLKFLILLFVVLLFVCSASAHQPRVELGTNSTFSNPILIENPELMQAFYGNLNGKPDFYQISSDDPFELCLGITVPASKGLGGLLPSVIVTDTSGNLVFTLNGTTGTWKPFIGEFKDSYLDGPEVTRNVSAGTYNIVVFNGNNDGKYLLLVGNKEILNADDYLQDIVNAPILKEQFFGKPVSLLFLEIMGFLLAFGTLMVAFIMMLSSLKSPEIGKISSKMTEIIKPVNYIGIGMTSILWLITMFKYSFSILVLFNTLVLIVAAVSGIVLITKISRQNFDKIALFTGVITVIFWCLFIYGAIIII